MAKILIQSTSNNVAMAAGATLHHTLGNSFIQVYTTEAWSQTTWRQAGTFSNFYVRVNTNSRTTNSTCRLRINGANGNQSVSVTALTTGEFEDVSGTDTIIATDEVNAQTVVGTGGSGFIAQIFSVLFEATSGTYQRFSLTNGNVATYDQVSTNLHIMPAAYHTKGGGQLEEVNQFQFKTAGVLKNLFVYVSANTSTQDFIVRMRVNGVDSGLAITIPAGSTGVLEDIVNTQDIAVDDLVCFQLASGTNANITIQQISVGFATTNNATHLIVGDPQFANTFPANATRYPSVAGTMSPRTTESDSAGDINHPTTLSFLQAYAVTNTLNAGASTIRLRINGANGNQVVSIGFGATGRFEDASGTDELDGTEQVNLSVVNTGATGVMGFSGIGMLSTAPGGAVVTGNDWPLFMSSGFMNWRF